ncbi:MAG: helix-turn-helix domain-containing protein [Proteobacteria bacterium]|nr:helix-turn-helix domain-containing protein [Pseudomonadota bacterium]
MAHEATNQLPREVRSRLEELGRNIRTARVRRRMRTEDLAKACGIGRRSLYRIENGEPGVALGTVMGVLWTLGLLDTFRDVANPDKDDHGKILEAASRPQRLHTPVSEDNDF